MQGAARPTGPLLAIPLTSLFARMVGVDMGEGADRRLARTDAGEAGFERIDSAQVTDTDRRSQGDRGPPVGRRRTHP